MRDAVSVPPPVSAAQRSVLYAVRRRGEATVADVASMLDMTASGARQHLGALADAGLLEAGDAARAPASTGAPSGPTASHRRPSRCSPGPTAS